MAKDNQRLMSTDCPLKLKCVGRLDDVIIESAWFRTGSIVRSAKTRERDGDGAIATMNFKQVPH
jgi:hypothetical protein